MNSRSKQRLWPRFRAPGHVPVSATATRQYRRIPLRRTSHAPVPYGVLRDRASRTASARPEYGKPILTYDPTVGSLTFFRHTRLPSNQIGNNGRSGGVALAPA